MSSLELHALTPADVPAAGRLLAARHRQHRLAEPLLSEVYEDDDACAREVAAALALEDASGAVAVRDGEVVGYLLGAPKSPASWGPNIWVESAGFGVANAEDVRDLYAFAARRWVEEGRTAHYALVPAHDPEVIDAWFRLAFGHQHTHAAQETRSSATAASGVLIRRARRDDIPLLARLDLTLPEHQALSPVFSSGPTSTLEEAQAEWEDDFDDEDFAVFVAETSSGDAVGSAIACSIEKSSLHAGPARPASAGFLGFAAVLPQARGLGAGRALGEAVISWSADQGYPGVVTDWRATNLLSSRTWPRLGFRDTFVRLHRVVGY